ncbi:MAG: preprotein translocase subunit SecG [Ruminococcaceae bacterium]|nr:preprotein translocase subunit SecG [Oscillospiraceae bacterium]
MMVTALYVIQIVVCLVLIISVLLQEGNSAGLSGSIAGGAETFFGKGKSKTLNGIFKSVTKVFAVLFVVLSLILTLISK